MKSLFRLVVTVLLLAGWSLAALSLHVVRAPADASGHERLGIVPKNTLAVSDTYVDARSWTMDDLAQHPQLVGRVIAAGRTEIFAPIVNGNTSGPTDVSEPLRNMIVRAEKEAKSSSKSTQPAATKRASADSSDSSGVAMQIEQELWAALFK